MASKDKAEIEVLQGIIRERLVNAMRQLAAELTAAGFAQDNIERAIDSLYPSDQDLIDLGDKLSYGAADDEPQAWPHDWPSED